MNYQEILQTPAYDFLRTDEHLGKNIILLTVGGSRAYGTNTESSDLDIRGVSMDTPKSLLGLHPFDSRCDEATDTTIYSLRRFISLAMKGNPNLYDILFCRPEEIVYETEEGKALREARHLFLSKRVVGAILGTCNNNQKRLGNYIVKDDWPHAFKAQMQTIRLLHAGITCLQTGVYPVYQDAWINEFQAIRSGKYQDLDSYFEEVERLEKELLAWKEKTTLPEKVDSQKIEDLQIQLLRKGLL